MVLLKNEVNIMVKNVVDVVFGGLFYWMFGYVFSFGKGNFGNLFCGIGYFFIDVDDKEMGQVYLEYFFQFLFVMIVIIIVFGVMVERIKLKVYILYLFFNILMYSFFVYWVWGEMGWFCQLGVIDIVGCSVVYLVGGVSGLVVIMMLKL